MNKKLSEIFIHSRLLYIYLIFFIFLIIFFLFLTNNKQKSYSYRIGEKWLYDNLLVEQSFFIKKNEKEYFEELEKIKKFTPLIIEYNPSLTANDSIYLQVLLPKNLKYIVNDSVKKYIENSEIAEIYINNVLIEEISSLNIKTISEVENVINSFLNNPAQKISVKENSFFNKEKYDKIIKEKQKNISVIKKIFKEGDVLIFKGEIISPEKKEIIDYYLNNIKPKELLKNKTWSFFYLLFIFTILFIYLYSFEKDIFFYVTKTLFVLLLMGIFVFITSILIKTNNEHYLYIVSFALIPIIIRAFYEPKTSLLIYLIFLLMLTPFVDKSYEFLFINLFPGIAATISLGNVRKRGQLFFTLILIFLSYVISYTIFNTIFYKEAEINHNVILLFAGNSVFVLASYPLIFIFEKSFGFISEITLIELTNMNHKLLRLLSEKAPGTFQHSLMVANIAEEIGFKINANTLLIRAGALYHDIGKIGLPNYFIENQVSSIDPHKDLDYDKSIEIIKGHIEYGKELAKKFKLPNQIIEFIETHHGTSIIQYFYKVFKEKFPNEEVNINEFRYSGKKPQTKEQALVMLVDAVEAASRTLKSYTEENIKKLIECIIDEKINDKQLDEANITIKEINIIKEQLKLKLLNVYHQRIPY